MKVAVTGGSGVVGQAVVRGLRLQGHEVVALARSEASEAILLGLGAAPVRGDVLDVDSLARLVEGAEWVFHVAGVNELCSPAPDRMDEVNIQGSRNVLRACEASGATRLIHTSSAVTLGEVAGSVGSEETVHRGRYRSRYERSKHLSEILVLSEARQVEVVVVNPASVQGPGRATGTGKLILDILTGDLRFLVDARISIVDIEDCARGHLLAAERGMPGERYVLSGWRSTVIEALSLLDDFVDLDIDTRFIPGWAASLGAGLVRTWATLRGRHPEVCREMVRTLRAGAWYDGSRAEHQLGLSYTPPEVTIRRTVAWFRQSGLLT